jgi:type IV secretory pathway VirB10-like protein
MHRKWLLLVLLPIATAILGATLYKWVDERGVTHYSETPPAKQKAQEIRIQPPPPSGAESEEPPQAPRAPGTEGGKAAPPKTWQQKALEAQLRREAAERKEEAEQARAREIAQQRLRRCLSARQNLHTLQTDRPVYQINEYGERVYIDDAKRAAEIERMKQEIQSNCDPKPPQ